MKQITKYEASDGMIFNNEDKCLEYEELIPQVNSIMKDLIPVPIEDSCRWENGEGYIQQNENVVKNARIALTNLGNKFFKQEGNNQWSFYSIGRLFDDSGYKCLYTAWGRLSHIDDMWREWGQRYYALHPEKGVQQPFISNQ